MGLLLTGVGVIGFFTPVLPGTIFLILALACFARGNERLESWLLDHPQFGPTLQDWRRTGGIRLKTKILISVIIMASVTVTIISCPLLGVQIGVGVLGLTGVAYVCTRPTTPDLRIS